jgi:hypothetical protein
MAKQEWILGMTIFAQQRLRKNVFPTKKFGQRFKFM